MGKVVFKNAVLLVRDVAESRTFYEQMLEQEIDEDFGRYIGFKGGFGIWLADFAHDLIFKEKGTDIFAGKRMVELYFETGELGIVSDRLLKAGVKIVHPIQEQPWGQRVMRFYDPDYHIIEVGESMESVAIRYFRSGMTVEEICKRTSLPGEVVRKAIDSGK